MSKKFKDLKVGDTVYVLIQETVEEKTVTDVDLRTDGKIELEVDNYTYIVQNFADYHTHRDEFIFASKDSLLRFLKAWIDIINGYIEKYS